MKAMPILSKNYGFPESFRTIMEDSKLSKDNLEETYLFLFGNTNSEMSLIVDDIREQISNVSEFNKSTQAEDFSMINYSYINVLQEKEFDGDVSRKINIWSFNETLDKDMIKTTIKAEFITRAVVAIVVDLSRPWEIMDSLKSWCEYVNDLFSNLLLELPFEKQQELRSKLENRIKVFEESQLVNREKTKHDSERVSLIKESPLKEGVLRTNLGVPILFIVNKSETAIGSQKKLNPEDSEFILKHIRKLALLYGASTIYISAKNNINIKLFYEYLLHLLYDFEFFHNSNFTCNASYFVPLGYDSLPVLETYDKTNDLNKIYNDRIIKYSVEVVKKQEEIVCENLDDFMFRNNSQNLREEQNRLNRLASLNWQPALPNPNRFPPCHIPTIPPLVNNTEQQREERNASLRRKIDQLRSIKRKCNNNDG